MSPNDYQRLCSRTECDQDAARQRYTGLYNVVHPTLLPVRLAHGVLGLTGEVGELASAVEKWLHYGQPLDLANVAEEVGDCLWYLCLICNAAGFSLEEIMEGNILKLQKRYPEKYSDEQAKEENRDRKAELGALLEKSRNLYDLHNPLSNPAGLSTYDTQQQRTKAEVMAARCVRKGCCERYFDDQDCDCLEKAL